MGIHLSESIETSLRGIEKRPSICLARHKRLVVVIWVLRVIAASILQKDAKCKSAILLTLNKDDDALAIALKYHIPQLLFVDA